MTYEQWDRIADAVVPCMGLVALSIPMLRSALNRWLHYLAIALTYAVTFSLNHADTLWRSIGLDYSGHTGVFIVAAVAIIAWRASLWWLVGSVFVLYVSLMLFQRYHTLADIAVTTIVMLPITALIHRFLQSGSRTVDRPSHTRAADLSGDT